MKGARRSLHVLPHTASFLHNSLTELSHSAWTWPTSCFLFPRFSCRWSRWQVWSRSGMVRSVVEEAVGVCGCARVCLWIKLSPWGLHCTDWVYGVSLNSAHHEHTQTHTSAQRKTYTCRHVCTESALYLPSEVLWERNRQPQYTLRVSRYT